MQAEQDQKLEEVRSILQRLQRISTDSGDELHAEEVYSAQPLRDMTAQNGSEPPSAAMASQPLSANIAAAAGKKEAAGGKGGKFLILGGIAIICAGGLAVFWPSDLTEIDAGQQHAATNATVTLARTDAAIPGAVTPDTATSSPAEVKAPADSPVEAQPLPPLDPDAGRISQAEQLMSLGKVTDARQILQDDLADRVAEAALMLARTYDPNALRLIADANAEADIVQAEQWYRRWYELAGQNGLTMDPERLNRIIQAMR